MSDLLAYFQERTVHMVEQVKLLASYETPTHDKAHVDALGTLLAEQCKELGAQIETFPQDKVGDVHVARWNNDAPGKPIMLLTHIDTVWPVGTLENMPLREENGVLYGPGVLDMKGGVVIALEAIRGLVERGELPERPIWLFLNSDEETGSAYSRALIHELAAQVGLVLVMEPAAEGEAIKTWRKGFARYRITTKGRASHAGQAPEQGINAVIEAAHQALFLHGLNDLAQGTSVSVTMIEGGIAINVIPPEASLQVDVRFLKMSEAERIDRTVNNLQPVLPGASVEIQGKIDRGPMERNEQMIRAFRQVQAIGASLGLELSEAGSGGGSDGNFTAAMGIPTLDGLGADGVGLHAAHEQLNIRSLPRRAALLAQLFQDWDMSKV